MQWGRMALGASSVKRHADRMVSSTLQRNDRRAPLQLLVRDGAVACPRHGRRPATECRTCAYSQGSVEGPDAAILCGYFEPRLAISRPLIFGLDWPDE